MRGRSIAPGLLAVALLGVCSGGFADDYARYQFARAASGAYELPAASSSVPTDAYGSYGPAMALDGKIETAWAEGAAGPGVGEVLLFPVPRGTKLLGVLPGFGVEGTFQRNHRLKDAILRVLVVESVEAVPEETIVRTAFEKTLSFADDMRLQQFPLDAAGLAERPWEYLIGVLEIRAVYRGSRYDDTCVAEVRCLLAPPEQRVVDALAARDVEALRAAIRSGAACDSLALDGSTFLQAAVAKGLGAEIVGLLLEGGADPDRLAPESTSPLVSAARTGDLATLALLLDHGADPELSSGFQHETALHVAAQRGPAAIVSALLASGANPNATTSERYVGTGGMPNESGLTPLHYAVAAGRTDVAALLLDAGADPNAATSYGRSPLHFALVAGSREYPYTGALDDTGVRRAVVGLLAALGADPAARFPTVGPRSTTPLEEARALGDTEILRLLGVR